jgi:Zn ribbon nucleic-acid-binding protein
MTKSIVTTRRKQGAVCPVCKSPDYKIYPPEEGLTKPTIVCNQCGKSWQNGKDGGIYKQQELETKNV